MAMKEKISLTRDRMIEKINSFDIDEIEKTHIKKRGAPYGVENDKRACIMRQAGI